MRPTSKSARSRTRKAGKMMCTVVRIENRGAFKVYMSTLEAQPSFKLTHAIPLAANEGRARRQGSNPKPK